MTKIVNLKKEEFDIYIGRGSIYGNPYECGKDGTLDDVLSRYEKWLDFLLLDQIFQREFNNLKGKSLGCFCKPKKCHGDIILKKLNENSILTNFK